MTNKPFIAHSELTNEIYIVSGKEKYLVTEQAVKAVKAIKALEQEPRKGHWLGDSAGYKCNICGHDLLEIAHSIDYIDFKKPNYCPSCGADMRGNTKRKGNPIEGNNESYNCENWIP